MSPRKVDPYVKFSTLHRNSQRVFAVIELILMRYNVEEMWITKEDLAWEVGMSVPSVKVALRELKKTGYIEAKNKNSPVLRIGDLYKYKGRR